MRRRNMREVRRCGGGERRRRLAAMLGLAVVPVLLSGCLIGHIDDADIQLLGYPTLITKVGAPPPVEPTMTVQEHYLENFQPVSLHLEIDLFKFAAVGAPILIHRKLFNDADLAGVNSYGYFTATWDCETGVYYSAWIWSGIDHTGKHQPSVVEIYPFNPGTKKHPLPKGKYVPTRRQAVRAKWKVATCR